MMLCRGIMFVGSVTQQTPCCLCRHKGTGSDSLRTQNTPTAVTFSESRRHALPSVDSLCHAWANRCTIHTSKRKSPETVMIYISNFVFGDVPYTPEKESPETFMGEVVHPVFDLGQLPKCFNSTLFCPGWHADSSHCLEWLRELCGGDLEEEAPAELRGVLRRLLSCVSETCYKHRCPFWENRWVSL